MDLQAPASNQGKGIFLLGTKREVTTLQAKTQSIEDDHLPQDAIPRRPRRGWVQGLLMGPMRALIGWGWPSPTGACGGLRGVTGAHRGVLPKWKVQCPKLGFCVARKGGGFLLLSGLEENVLHTPPRQHTPQALGQCGAEGARSAVP